MGLNKSEVHFERIVSNDTKELSPLHELARIVCWTTPVLPSHLAPKRGWTSQRKTPQRKTPQCKRCHYRI